MVAPIWGLPPDLIVYPGEDVCAQAPNVWHLPKDVWNPIWERFRGQRERIAFLDTGYTPHNDLPTPVASRSFIRGEEIRDGNGHGNHVAGTGLGRNGIGVAPDAELLVGKVLSNSGRGSSDAITDGINWAIDEGATIISLSLGGGSPYAPTSRAIARANDNRILVCASAGNAGQRLPNNTIGNPARDMGSYCSGSMDEVGNISTFSSAGREMDGVTPGSKIVSASHRSASAYTTMGGTSMSCPFFAGLAAVVRSGMAMAGLPRLGGIDDWRPWLQKFFIDQGPPGHDWIWGWGIPDYRKIVQLLMQPQVKFV